MWNFLPRSKVQAFESGQWSSFGRKISFDLEHKRSLNYKSAQICLDGWFYWTVLDSGGRFCWSVSNIEGLFVASVLFYAHLGSTGSFLGSSIQEIDLLIRDCWAILASRFCGEPCIDEWFHRAMQSVGRLHLILHCLKHATAFRLLDPKMWTVDTVRGNLLSSTLS